MRIPFPTAACLALLLLAGYQNAADVRPAASAEPGTPAMPLRFATCNTSLFDEEHGGLITRLDEGDEDARRIAATVQHQRPDVVLLNEFDYDDAHRSLGGYAILRQVQRAREEGRQHVYLGFWLDGHPKMPYKRGDRPLEFLDGASWRPMPG